MPTHIMLLYSTFTQIYTHWPDRNAVLASRQCLLHIMLCTEVSHKGKSCSIFLNQHNFICSKFHKLYNYNINILPNKTTGL